jgi:co-chaperonin GroES (HSP10)
MMNKSGINPTGHYILVLPDEVKTKTDSGLILVPETVEQKERETTKGILVAIGSIGWNEFDDKTPWAKVGDHVCYGKYAGRAMDGVDGKKYVLANAEDILAVLDD